MLNEVHNLGWSSTLIGKALRMLPQKHNSVFLRAVRMLGRSLKVIDVPSICNYDQPGYYHIPGNIAAVAYAMGYSSSTDVFATTAEAGDGQQFHSCQLGKQCNQGSTSSPPFGIWRLHRGRAGALLATGRLTAHRPDPVQTS